MDQITIADLEVHYRVGVPDEERAHPQRLLLTIELFTDFSRATAGDDLRHTIDYDSLSRSLVSFGNDRSWKLIETLAEDMARFILLNFKPAAVQLEIRKFILPNTRYVSVRIRRERPISGTAPLDAASD